MNERAVIGIVAGSLAGPGRAALATVAGLLGDVDGACLRALSAGRRARTPVLPPLAGARGLCSSLGDSRTAVKIGENFVSVFYTPINS